ncbi:MAG: CRISPR-associated protein Cas2 [Verrucomicrobia bacterium]|nr:CRISPR-associated protein Cas2 [Verrucomicrobiota bacterium]
MNKILVSYDLKAPHRDYSKLITALKTFELWARPLESTWLLVTSQNTTQVRDSLMALVDENDKILVVELTGGWNSLNVVKEVVDWMKRNIR